MKIFSKIKSLLYGWCPDSCYTKWWMKHVYWRVRTNEHLMVIIPLNYLVWLTIWIEDKYATWRHRESFIDRLVQERYNLNRQHKLNLILQRSSTFEEDYKKHEKA